MTASQRFAIAIHDLSRPNRRRGAPRLKRNDAEREAHDVHRESCDLAIAAFIRALEFRGPPASVPQSRA
jgi:hypothetical protein